MNKIKIIKIISALFLGLSALIAGGGCPPAKVSSQVPTDADWCKPGCEHLQQLVGRDGHQGCEESRSLDMPDGEIVTCEEFCKQTETAGRNMFPSCWTLVKTCDEIEKYHNRTVPCDGH